MTCKDKSKCGCKSCKHGKMTAQDIMGMMKGKR